jgi:hypothetical protein
METVPPSNLSGLVFYVCLIVAVTIILLRAIGLGYVPDVITKHFRLRWSKGEQDKISQESKKSSPHPDPKNRLLTPIDEPSCNISSYEVYWTHECLEDISRIGINKTSLIDMLSKEFRSHMNYFRFDLEDYVIPLQSKYLLRLEKIGREIKFFGLSECTSDQAQLAAWNDILSVYRRATRMAYREDPNVIIFQGGHFGRAINLHMDLRARLTKYFRQFYNINIDEVFHNIAGAQGTASIRLPPRDNASAICEESAQSIVYHMVSSSRSSKEAVDIASDIEIGDTVNHRALGPLVLSLERSLQHIHKIITSFPPRQV